MEEERRADGLYYQLGLDPVVDKVLRDYPTSLSGMDRLLDRVFGPYDVKGRAKAVSKASVMAAHATLRQECEQEMAKLEERAIQLERECASVKDKYDNLVQRVAGSLTEDRERLASVRTSVLSAVDRLRTSYEKLEAAITALGSTIPYDEIREKSGEELYAVLLRDSGSHSTLVENTSKLIDLRRYLGMAAVTGAETAVRRAVEVLTDLVASTKRRTETAATLYTETGVLSGSVYHLQGERISDLLNGASGGRSRQDGSFVEFYDVRARGSDGGSQALPVGHVKKSTIHMVTLADSNAGRGAGAGDATKSFPFVPKTRVPVLLQMPDISILANIHCAGEQRPQDVVDQTPAFVSLTDVSVRLKNETSRFTVPYAAVNKERIVRLDQEEIPLESSAAVEDYYLKLMKARLGWAN